MILSLILAFGSRAPSPPKPTQPVKPLPPPVVIENPAIEDILNIYNGSQCKSFGFRDVEGGREPAPRAFMQGLVLSYAQSRCKNHPKLKDLDLDRQYALLISLASYESTWNVCEGKDKNANTGHGFDTEAGAWQTSWDATGMVPGLADFFVTWQGNCFKKEFGNKNCDHSKTWGDKTKIYAKFQYSSKNCPAMAAEFALVTINKIGPIHYWPIKNKVTEIPDVCVSMFNQINALLLVNPALCEKLK